MKHFKHHCINNVTNVLKCGHEKLVCRFPLTNFNQKLLAAYHGVMESMKRKFSPTAIALCFSLVLISLYVIFTITDSYGLFPSLNENQILYLFSTSAQVVSGIYGLTLTGFIFFRNELSREEAEDETLADAVERLKQRYSKVLQYVTFFVVCTIFLSSVAISIESSENTRLIKNIMNLGQAAFVTSIFSIIYFIFDVISPKRVETTSKLLQEEIDPSTATTEKGSLEEFLSNYNRIEYLLNNSGEVYQPSNSNYYPSKSQKRVSNMRLAETLYRNEKIDGNLYEQIRGLISLRNSIIHGAEPIVSQHLVEVSKEVLDALNNKLQS